MGVILKLLNVNAAARLLTPGYSGPLVAVAEDPLLRDVRPAAPAARAKLAQLAAEAFSSLAPPPAHAAAAANTGMGFSVDAAAAFDAASGRPKSVAKRDLMEPGAEQGEVK